METLEHCVVTVVVVPHPHPPVCSILPTVSPQYAHCVPAVCPYAHIVPTVFPICPQYVVLVPTVCSYAHSVSTVCPICLQYAKCAHSASIATCGDHCGQYTGKQVAALKCGACVGSTIWGPHPAQNVGMLLAHNKPN